MAASFVSRPARTLYRYFDLRFYLETRLLTKVASRFFFYVLNAMQTKIIEKDLVKMFQL